MAKYKVCQACHGAGQIYKEVSPGKWVWIKCPAGCQNGVVPMPNI